MKLRMRGDSIRLRLTRSEVALFEETGHLEEVVSFPSGELRYALERSTDSPLAADFINGTLTVRVPASVAHLWAATEQVGTEAQCGQLNILIEKDFQCAHGPVDDDAFPAQGNEDAGGPTLKIS